jgi:hypothetical protein
MALEIEFEDDDQTDAAWQADGLDTGGASVDAGAGTGTGTDREIGADDGGPSTLVVGSSRRGVTALLPERLKQQLPFHAGILVAAFVVGASTVAGFLAGRSATQDRTVIELHMTGGNAYSVAAATPSGSGQRTDTFVRQVSLSLVNDGPDPVTLRSGTVNGPYEHGKFGFPRTGLKIAAGAATTLRAATTIDCRGVFGALRLTNGNSSPLNTVANFEVTTADGRTGGTSLLVDLASAAVVADVCSQVPPPVRIGAPQSGPLIPPSSYRITYPIENAAPFPVRVTSLVTSVRQWMTAGGLSITANGNSVIPADGDGSYVVQVSVAACATALAATDNQFGDFPLVFTDTEGGANPDMFVEEAPIVVHGLIAQACHGH